MISLPPSSTGLFQVTVTVFLVTFVTSGFPGGPGGPVQEEKSIVKPKIKSLEINKTTLESLSFFYLPNLSTILTGSDCTGSPLPY